MRSRLKLRVIGLCLALAALMAISAGAAQAEEGAYWLVNGVKVTTLLPEKIVEVKNAHSVFLGTIGGAPVHILCKQMALVTGNHDFFSGGWLGMMRPEACDILTLKEGKAVALPACTPPGSQFTTTALKGLIRLSSGTPVLVVEPNSGTTFATISTSEECALGEKIVIGGKFGLQDAENAFLTDQVTHTMREHAATTKLFFNGNEANKVTFDGELQFKLAGVHKGLTWAGHPG